MQRELEDAEKQYADAMNPPKEPEAKEPEKEPEKPKEPEARTPEEKPSAPDENWKERFIGYRTKMDKTVHELRTEIDRKDEEQAKLVEGFQAQINELKTQLAKNSVPAVNLDAIKEEYGEGALPEILATQNSLIQDLKAEISDLRESQSKYAQKVDDVGSSVTYMRQETALSKEDAFFDALDNAVPKWMTYNTDPRFIEWLSKRAPHTRVSRQQLLTDASESFDSEIAIEIFTDWQNQLEAAQPQPNTMPERSSSGDISDEPQKKIWTQKEIDAEYEQIRRHKRTQEEIDSFERAIWVAHQEGRLRA